jgi:hypothetical protein
VLENLEEQFYARKDNPEGQKILLKRVQQEAFPERMIIEHHEPDARPPDGVSLDNPLPLFSLFFTPDTLEAIARNTNKNPALKCAKENPIENPHIYISMLRLVNLI